MDLRFKYYRKFDFYSHIEPFNHDYHPGRKKITCSYCKTYYFIDFKDVPNLNTDFRNHCFICKAYSAKPDNRKILNKI